MILIPPRRRGSAGLARFLHGYRLALYDRKIQLDSGAEFAIL